MGRRISKGDKGSELFQSLFGSLTFHRLWLIDNHYRICFGDDINRTSGTKLIKLHINTPGVLASCVKRLAVDNHHVNCTIRSKTVNLGELRGIINEVADFLSVILGKMLLRHLERLINTLTNSYAWYNYDKFAPAVPLVKLVHGLDICIGFADTCFHLNGQVKTAYK